mgnify:CR=1 FL=1
MTDRLDGLSMDIEAENKARLASVFPECFTEGRLDIDKLLSLCGEYTTDDFEKYEFKWKGKSECLRLAQRRSTATLRPCPSESVHFDTTQNLYIEGDNLEVLKLLQKSYFRKIKMIYIDPPYNTGNDFVYEDDFKDPLARYKEVTQQTTKSNPETMGRYHTNWLNMMYPRLRLAANLLRDDGVIFISIDDNEVDNLKKLCNEVFGEENFVGNIIWKNATDNNPTQIAIEHEYILCYAKQKSEAEAVWKTKVSAVKDILIEIGEKLIAEYDDKALLQSAYSEWLKKNKSFLWPLDRYKYIDKGGVYTGSQSVHNPGREGYRYDIIHPKTGKPCVQPLLGYRFPKDTMQALIADGKILFGSDEKKIVELKVYAKDYEEKLSSIFELDGRIGAYDLKTFFGEKPIFSNPKPVQLIQRLLSFITTDDDIVLDFFAGSGTTAHAVMALNSIDGKSRKMMSVQLPENLDINLLTAEQKVKSIINNAIEFLSSIERPHYITEIGKERIRRAGAKILAEVEERNRQTKLGEEEKALPDVGFKVFKLDTSNMKIWDDTLIEDGDVATLFDRIDGHIDGLKPDRSDEDLIYEILLKMGYPLTADLATADIGGLTVYKVANGEMLVCLQEGITAEHIEQMAALAPQKVVLAGRGLADSSTKANAFYLLENRGIELKIV